MGVTNFPNGVASFGMPVLPGADRPYGGTAYFVSNRSGANGSNGNNGLSRSQPFSTLAYALTQVTAANDDVIYVLQGHAESLPTAAFIACSKAGVSIVGLGNGRARPTFTWTGTAATWTVSAANVTISNCVFVGTGIDAVVTMFAITGDDCTIDGCEFDCAITSFVALLGITVTGTDRFRFTNNHVHGRAAANMTNFLQIVGASGKQKDYVIAGNSITGNYTTTLGAINNITAAVTDIVIRDNTIVNRTASATKAIVLLTGSTGMVMNNGFGIGSGAAPITGDAVHWARNWSAAAVATNGSLV
jgi:hypothetical protein